MCGSPWSFSFQNCQHTLPRKSSLHRGLFSLNECLIELPTVEALHRIFLQLSQPFLSFHVTDLKHTPLDVKPPCKCLKCLGKQQQQNLMEAPQETPADRKQRRREPPAEGAGELPRDRGRHPWRQRWRTSKSDPSNHVSAALRSETNTFVLVLRI